MNTRMGNELRTNFYFLARYYAADHQYEWKLQL